MSSKILTYAKLYKRWKTTEDVDETLIEAMRDELTRQGEYKRLVAVEKTVDYESSGRLKEFVDSAKRLLIDTTHENLLEFERLNPMDIKKSSLENWTAAMIVYFVYDYLTEVER